MAFKNETIKKAVRMIKSAVARFDEIAVGKLKVSISNGNIKIGRVMNVSLPPVISCGNCKECKCLCYDIKAVVRYKNVVDSRARNWSIFKRDRREFFRQIEAKIKRRKRNKYFRWHVAGEIVDMDHLREIIRIARENPDFTFWMYTKMYWIVNEYVRENGGAREIAIPSNLSIMFSEWRGLPMDNPYGFPIFTVVFKGEEPPKNMWRCPGNCDVCKKANRGCIAGEDTYNFEH